MLTQNELKHFLDVGKSASALGAQILRKYFGHIREVHVKPDTSLVSNADQESEQVIAEYLRQHLPQFGFNGEESGLSTSTTPSVGVWHVDPLDGTTNYIHGFPYFSTSLGLEIDGQIVVSIIDAPILDLSYWAVLGGGAFKNGQRIKVSSTSSLHQALLATGFSYENSEDRKVQIEVFSHFLKQARGIRRPGAAALDLCYTAEGVFDGFWEKQLKTWDMAAGALLVTEAGGTISNINGHPWNPSHTSMIAGGHEIQALMTQNIQKMIEQSHNSSSKI